MQTVEDDGHAAAGQFAQFRETTEKLKARGSPAPESNFRDERGRLLARLRDSETKYGQPPMSVMRSDICAVLADEMRAQKIPIHYGKRLRLIDQAAATDTVAAQFADGSRAEGDLLVGADGIHSQTRGQTMPDAPHPEFVGISGIGGKIALSAVPFLSSREAQSFNFTFGPCGFFGYCGGSVDEEMWWTNLPREKPYSAEELKSLSSQVLREQLLARFGGYYEPIPTLIARTPEIIALNVFDIRSLPRWHEGRVLLIGDAAHAVSPNAGQGAALALEDAMYLAKVLRDCGSDYVEAFACFERDRKPLWQYNTTPVDLLRWEFERLLK